jgi:hypothetical protein
MKGHKMTNPFTLRVIPSDFPFCNRSAEQRELFFHAKNKLEKLDFIEKHNDVWSVVDPVFGKRLSMF